MDAVLLQVLCLLLVPVPLSSGEPSTDVEVLILGAGISGITAAKTLSESNITNFLILEAEDKIGGRVKNTVLKSGVRVELGANWIQGIDPDQPEKHPLWKIAQECGGLDGNFTQTFNYYSSAHMHVFDENGTNITNSAVFNERLAQFQKVLDPGLISYSKSQSAKDLPDMSVRQALTDNGWTPTSPLDNLIEWNGLDLDEYAIAPEHVSLYGNFPDDTYFDFGNPKNTENYFVTDQKEGFVKVVRCLADQFLSTDDHRLHLESTVVEVDWTDSKRVCVTTKEGNTRKEYCAQYAILTFSLGVLKSDAITFIPALPVAKQNAIKSNDSYILYLKIFLEFEEIFWKGEEYTFNILHVDAVRGHFVQFQPIRPTIPILFTTVTGEIAKKVYDQIGDNTTHQIMQVLRTIYGQDIPDPIGVTIPDWWVNPFFRGTYSNTPLGTGEDELKALKEPAGQLHFGGEATSDAYSGYVHGGYFSGIDVANEVIKKREAAKGSEDL